MVGDMKPFKIHFYTISPSNICTRTLDAIQAISISTPVAKFKMPSEIANELTP